MKTFKQAILLQNGGIGDFLMAIFLAEQLKKYGIAPESQIVVHQGSTFLHGFMGSYPYISLLEVSISYPRSLLSIFGLLKSGNLVILPPTIGWFPLKIKFFAWLLAKLPGGFLIGFQDSGYLCGILYSTNLPYKINQTFDKNTYDILKALGVSPVEESPTLKIEPSFASVKQLNPLNKPYILFHPRGASDRRRLNREESSMLINSMLSFIPQYNVIISGAKNERREIETLVKLSGTLERVQAAIGLSPKELVGLIDKAKIFVGMDTGITHMACFLGKRSLVIAKNATANWLPFYNKNATVIFRFKEDEESQTSEEYMWAHQNGRLRPFGGVSMADISEELQKMCQE